MNSIVTTQSIPQTVPPVAGPQSSAPILDPEVVSQPSPLAVQLATPVTQAPPVVGSNQAAEAQSVNMAQQKAAEARAEAEAAAARARAGNPSEVDTVMDKLFNPESSSANDESFFTQIISFMQNPLQIFDAAQNRILAHFQNMAAPLIKLTESDAQRQAATIAKIAKAAEEAERAAEPERRKDFVNALRAFADNVEKHGLSPAEGGAATATNNQVVGIKPAVAAMLDPKLAQLN